MSRGLPVLSAAALGALASAAERGLLAAPVGPIQIARHVGSSEQIEAVRVINGLHATGLEGKALAAALRLAEASRRAGDERPRPALVWSELDLAGSRDTAVVCNELFRGAQRSVIVSTFNLGHKAKPGDPKGNPVLRPLAQRMADARELHVRLFLNLRRIKKMAGATQRQVEDAFVRWFRHEIWPWDPAPEVYYDPRSLEGTSNDRPCLHAKCVVVDDARAFVTSANLTEAAHTRNIEAGVLIDDAVFARSLRVQFESLIGRGYVRPLPCRSWA